MSACVRERCAVLGDKWVVLDTAICIKDHPLISQHSAPLADANTQLQPKILQQRINTYVGASFLFTVHRDL